MKVVLGSNVSAGLVLDARVEEEKKKARVPAEVALGSR